jgi:hypothetical protein
VRRAGGRRYLPGDADALLEAARNAAPTAPHFGQAEVNQYLECALWPAPSHPLEAPSGPIDPQVLVVATTTDPADATATTTAGSGAAATTTTTTTTAGG